MTTNENEVRRLAAGIATARWIALAAAAVAVIALALGAMALSRSLHVEMPTGPAALDAAEITLHDSDGSLRGRWSAQGLSLADRTGRMRAGVTLGNDGAPNLTLFSKNGGVRAVVGLGADDTPAITLHDGTSRVRTRILIGEADAPSVTIMDAQGNVVGRLPETAVTPGLPAKSTPAVKRRTGR